MPSDSTWRRTFPGLRNWRGALAAAVLVASALTTLSWSLASSVQVAAGNVLVNPSFESSTMTNWSSWQGAVSRVALSGAPDGGYVARVAQTTGTAYSLEYDPAVAQTSAAGQGYNASAYVAAASSSSVGKPVGLVLRERRNGVQVAQSQSTVIPLSTTFQHFSVSAKVQQSGDVLDVYVWQGNAGSGNAFNADVVTLSTSALTATPTPTTAPGPFAITGVPCTVTVNGIQETGTCSGTFNPTSSSTSTPTPTASSTPAPTTTATPIHTPVPTPTPTPVSGCPQIATGIYLGANCGRPFSAQSPFNETIPGNATGYALPSKFVTPTHTVGGTDWTWSIPFFDGTGARQAPVNCTESWGTCGLQPSVPIPTDAHTNSGSDGVMAISDFAAHQSYEFWQAKNNGNGTWSTSWGGTCDLTGLGVHCGFAVAADVSRQAGIIRWWEQLPGATINHALVFAVPDTCSGTYLYPATATDGRNTDAGCIPEGSRIQLDPSVNCNALTTGIDNNICHALQTYGAYDIDSGASMGIGFAMEAQPNGSSTPSTTSHIPWSQVRVLNNCFCSTRPAGTP